MLVATADVVVVERALAAAVSMLSPRADDDIIISATAAFAII